MKYNLDCIYGISKDDSEFIDQFWSIVKTEWPVETEQYRQSMNIKEYKTAASVVHRLKHKFKLFGASDGHELAYLHEKSLQQDSTLYATEYNGILIELTNFINQTNPHRARGAFS